MWYNVPAEYVDSEYDFFCACLSQKTHSEVVRKLFWKFLGVEDYVGQRNRYYQLTLEQYRRLKLFSNPNRVALIKAFVAQNSESENENQPDEA